MEQSYIAQLIRLFQTLQNYMQFTCITQSGA